MSRFTVVHMAKKHRPGICECEVVKETDSWAEGVGLVLDAPRKRDVRCLTTRVWECHKRIYGRRDTE